MPPQPSISLPRPCSQDWAILTPTAAGRHCAACATEVVDFTRLSNAEILAYLARRGGQPVCASIYSSQLTLAPAAPWRRWLLAGLALLGWQPVVSCNTTPPQPPPQTSSVADPTSQPLVIKGQVLDGATGPAVAGVLIFINDTPYGAVTDTQGRFELVLSRTWAPIQAGPVALRFEGSGFDFRPQTVKVAWQNAAAPGLLVVRLESIPERGRLMGELGMPATPLTPPKD